MSTYDLCEETIQKKYGTGAAQFYRQRLANKLLESENPKKTFVMKKLKINAEVEKPDYTTGRRRYQGMGKITP